MTGLLYLKASEVKKPVRDIIKPAAVLFIICLLVTGGLAFTYSSTKDIIAERAEQEAENARKEVLASADSFEEIEGVSDTASKNASLKAVDKAYRGLKDGMIDGYVYQVITKGYGGNIKMMVGINSEGSITGVKIIEMSETPGLGSKAKEDPFALQLSGFVPQSPLSVVKGAKEKSEDIQAISGATITSKAVVEGIQAAVDFSSELIEKEGK